MNVLHDFAETYGITFPILADEGSEVIKNFGILNTLIRPEEEEHYGIPFPGSYLVETDGLVAGRFFNREYQVRETSATVLRSGFHLPVDPAMMVHEETSADGVIVRAELAATELHARQRALLYVTLDLDEGLHVYGKPVPDGYIPTTVEVTGTEGIEIGNPEYPTTKPFRVQGLSESFEVFVGQTQIVVPVVSTIREVGTATLDVVVHYQACNSQECFIPRRETMQLEFETGPALRRTDR